MNTKKYGKEPLSYGNFYIKSHCFIASLRTASIFFLSPPLANETDFLMALNEE